MITTTVALSFSLGALAGVAMYLFGVSVARGREADRLHAERLRRAEHWGGFCLDGLTIFDLPEHPIVEDDEQKGGAKNENS